MTSKFTTWLFLKKWHDLITDGVLIKVYKKSDKHIKKPPKYMISSHFGIKGLEFIHLNCILYENEINCLPERLQEDEIPSAIYVAIYTLFNTIRNKNFNYKGTVNNINTDDTITYEIGKVHATVLIRNIQIIIMGTL